MDTHSFEFSSKRIKNLTESSKHCPENLDFQELDPSQELSSEDNENILAKNKSKTAPHFDLEEAIFLKSKSYSTKMKPFENKTKQASQADSLRCKQRSARS